MVEPEFGNCEASKAANDWNDLVRLKGFEFAKAQILEKLDGALIHLMNKKSHS